MNVATCGAIKGAVSALDLKQLGCQVELCNTYHLHLRPTDEVVKQLGGIRAFTRWDGPVLTDSGGFQVFHLRSFETSGRREYILTRILTAENFYESRSKYANTVKPRFNYCNGF